jgi:SAM-dependent methyltransferase
MIAHSPFKSTEIYSQYDRFAWFYNRHWGDEFCAPVLDIFQFILFPQLNPGARILDLCCGTGQLAAALTGRGYGVTGIDGSRSMLEHASRNAPRATFIRADARSFTADAPFSAVVSTFDSLNHVLDLTGMREVFGCVLKALEPGGIFVFDLNTEDEFLTGAREAMFDLVEDDHACVVRSRYDLKTRMKYYEVTMFTLEADDWKRGDLTLVQRYYDAEEIVNLLNETGFERIVVHDAKDKFDFSISDGRAFFVACRPPA